MGPGSVPVVASPVSTSIAMAPCLTAQCSQSG
jgi:hypothetical protein